MTYDCAGVPHLLCVDLDKAWQVASVAPEADQIIVLANAPTYGGAGYPASNVATAAGAYPSANLILHEHGFIYKRKKIHFSELRGVFIGQNKSASAELAQDLGSLMSWHPVSKIMDRSIQASVTLALDENKNVVMKNVLFENNWEDVQKFFGFIQEEHPDIYFQS